MSIEGEGNLSPENGLLVYLSPYADGSGGGGSVLSLSPRSTASEFRAGSRSHCDVLHVGSDVDGQVAWTTPNWGVGVAVTSGLNSTPEWRRYLAAVTRHRFGGAFARDGYYVSFVDYIVYEQGSPSPDYIYPITVAEDFGPVVVPVDLERLPNAGKFFMVGAHMNPWTSW